MHIVMYTFILNVLLLAWVASTAPGLAQDTVAPDDTGSPPNNTKSPLALARALTPPTPEAQINAEYEHAAFWERHGPLLRAAWTELDDGPNDDPLADFIGDGGNVTRAIEPSLARACAAARASGGAHEDERRVRALWPEAAPGVHASRLLTTEAIARSAERSTERDAVQMRYGLAHLSRTICSSPSC